MVAVQVHPVDCRRLRMMKGESAENSKPDVAVVRFAKLTLLVPQLVAAARVPRTSKTSDSRRSVSVVRTMSRHPKDGVD